MLAVTAAAFDRYQQLFGVWYPFGEYHQAFLPDFNAGAMENPGCVIFRGLRDHFGQHAYGNAEFSDLIAAWTRAGAVGLSDWAAAWLRTSGLDTLLGDVRDGQIVLQRTSPDVSRRPHAIRVAGYSA